MQVHKHQARVQVCASVCCTQCATCMHLHASGVCVCTLAHACTSHARCWCTHCACMRFAHMQGLYTMCMYAFAHMQGLCICTLYVHSACVFMAVSVWPYIHMDDRLCLHSPRGRTETCQLKVRTHCLKSCRRRRRIQEDIARGMA